MKAKRIKKAVALLACCLSVFSALTACEFPMPVLSSSENSESSVEEVSSKSESKEESESEEESESDSSVEETPIEEYTFDFEKAKGCSVSITKNTDEEYLVDDGDDWSFSYKPTGTWTFWKFEGSNEIVWEGVKELRFYVYNPNYEYDYVFKLFMAETMALQHNVDVLEKFGTTCKAEAGGWTEIVVSGEAAKRVFDTGKQYFGMSCDYTANGGTKDSEQWQQIQLYFDGFEFIRE